MYRDRMLSLLGPESAAILDTLNSPQRIQDYLDLLTINFEMRGETYMSPMRTLTAQSAHCFEGALLAAAALLWHGRPPLLMDLRTIASDEDHVVALFKLEGSWGAVSKTNHAILRYRDAVYRSPRELAMSYFHEYVMDSGVKSLRAYSAPFDLRKFPLERWVSAPDDLHWLVNKLDESRHFPIAPRKNVRRLRKASPTELRALKISEYKAPKGFQRDGK